MTTSSMFNSRHFLCIQLATVLLWSAFEMNAQPGSVGAWTATTSLPYPVEAPSAVAFQGRIYVLGGFANPPGGVPPYLANAVHSSVVNPDGSLQPWQPTTAFATGRYLAAVAVNAVTRTIYVVGGATSNGTPQNGTNDVQYAQITPSGVGTWVNTTPLPFGTSGHSAFCYGGYLYVFRGNDQFFGWPGYYYAAINPDGSVGAWKRGTFGFPVRTYYGAFAYNDHFYVLGGRNGFSTFFNDVYSARVPQRSSLNNLQMYETENWTTTTPFSVPRFFQGTAFENGFVYITGGYSSVGVPDRSDVQFARILGDGSLSAWQTSTALPTTLAQHACIAYSGRLYVLGGDYSPNGFSFAQTASVLYAPILSSADTTPPKTQISPPAGQQPSSPVNVTLTASDVGGSGVVSIRRTTDGTDPRTSPSAVVVNASSVTFSFPVSLTLKFSATDAAENMELPQTAAYSTAQPNYVTAFQFPSDSRYPIDPQIELTAELLPYDQQFVSNDFDPLPNHHFYRVAQDFGENNANIIPPAPYTESRHLGEDWNWGSTVDDYGKNVHAIGKGTVVFSGAASGFGRVIIIKHSLPLSFPDVPTASDGSKFVNSLYGHLGSEPNQWRALGIRNLQVGDVVEGGEAIGYVGNNLENGNVPPHFHLEVRLPNCPILNTPGPGYFPRATVPSPLGWIDPSAFIKKYRASLLQLQRLPSGGLNDAANTTPTIAAGGSSVGFKNSPTFHIVDLSTGLVQAENSDGDGTLGNGELFTPAFSADFKVKAFATDNANLVANDTNGVPDIFVWTQTNGVTTRASISSGGDQANGASYDVGISGDGRFVVFTSVATNLVANDTNRVTDIFVRDRETNQTFLVSVTSSDVQGNGPSYSPSISADGRFVAFISEATNLLAGDTNGVADVFVRDLQTNTTVWVSKTWNGSLADGPSRQPSISGDGRYTAYESDASNLVPNDGNGYADVFLYDSATGTVQKLSIGSTGEQGNGASRHPRISSYGLRVAFTSEASNLALNDTNGLPDIFVASFIATPILNVAFADNSVVLSWSTNAALFNLESATNLNPSAVWSPVSPAPTAVGEQNFVTNPASGSGKFYRLKK